MFIKCKPRETGSQYLIPGRNLKSQSRIFGVKDRETEQITRYVCTFIHRKVLNVQIEGFIRNCAKHIFYFPSEMKETYFFSKMVSLLNTAGS